MIIKQKKSNQLLKNNKNKKTYKEPRLCVSNHDFLLTIQLKRFCNRINTINTMNDHATWFHPASQIVSTHSKLTANLSISVCYVRFAIKLRHLE